MLYDRLYGKNKDGQKGKLEMADAGTAVDKLLLDTKSEAVSPRTVTSKNSVGLSAKRTNKS